MSIVVNVLNITVIALFGMTVIHFYNRYTEYFFAMLIAIVYWAQLLVSSAYIETGIYLMDIGKDSYPTGVTIRLFLMIEIYFMVLFYLARKHPIKERVEGTLSRYKDYKKVLILLFLVYSYRLADILVSGNIFNNVLVNRFDYYRDISTFPFAAIVQYFSFPLMWLAGYIMTLAENKKQRIFPILIFAINVFSLFLIGVQFGGYLQSALYFFCPTLLRLAKKRKLLRLRYAVMVAAVFLVMLIPKYNHFEEAIASGYANTSFGLNTAYDFLMYRALGQEADLTWEIDREIVEEGFIEPDRFFEQIQEVLGIEVDTTTQYLMNRGLSGSALTRYSWGSAAVTGGYLVSWAAMFGYIFAIPFWMLDAALLFAVVKLICDGMAKQRLFILLAGGYLFCQCYTIIISANFSAMGNTIPHILIVLLLFLYKKPKKFKLGNRVYRI